MNTVTGKALPAGRGILWG